MILNNFHSLYYYLICHHLIALSSINLNLVIRIISSSFSTLEGHFCLLKALHFLRLIRSPTLSKVQSHLSKILSKIINSLISPSVRPTSLVFFAWAYKQPLDKANIYLLLSTHQSLPLSILYQRRPIIKRLSS